MNTKEGLVLAVQQDPQARASVFPALATTLELEGETDHALLTFLRAGSVPEGARGTLRAKMRELLGAGTAFSVLPQECYPLELHPVVAAMRLPEYDEHRVHLPHFGRGCSAIAQITRTHAHLALEAAELKTASTALSANENMRRLWRSVRGPDGRFADSDIAKFSDGVRGNVLELPPDDADRRRLERELPEAAAMGWGKVLDSCLESLRTRFNGGEIGTQSVDFFFQVVDQASNAVAQLGAAYPQRAAVEKELQDAVGKVRLARARGKLEAFRAAAGSFTVATSDDVLNRWLALQIALHALTPEGPQHSLVEAEASRLRLELESKLKLPAQVGISQFVAAPVGGDQ